jgi:hypothetical protein
MGFNSGLKWLIVPWPPIKKNACCKSKTIPVHVLTNSLPHVLVYIRELEAELCAY